MGFDKAKVIRAAEKSLAQGKIPAAIKEYRLIVENDPDDFTALNMLGDLYVRVEKSRDAIMCFKRIAEYYHVQGFALKAIAMYKKIDRLSPGTPEISLNLAELYTLQGLIVEARTQYLSVAEACTRAGDEVKALAVLRKIADLEPQNTEIRFQLANGYLHQRKNAEAATAFVEAGEQFNAKHNYDRAIEAYCKALEVVSFDRTAVAGLLTAHIARGTPEEAADVIERAVAAHPRDAHLLSMLATAHFEAANPAEAELATIALVDLEPSSFQRFIEVARLYLDENSPDDAIRILGNITERLLAGRSENSLLDLVTEVLARNPDQVEALRLLVRIHAWQRDDDKMRQTLERLAEAAQAAGLVDQERYALSQLIRLVPEFPYYAERLEKLGGVLETPVEEVSQYNANVPGDQSFQDSKDFATVSPTPALEFEWNSVSTDEPVAEVSFADLATEETTLVDDQPIEFADVPLRETEPSEDHNEFDFGIGTAEDSTTVVHDSTSGSTLDPQREHFLRQELDSVDFYIAQGYTDIAIDTLNMLEGQFGPNPMILSRRSSLGEATTVSAPAASQAPSTRGTTDEFSFADLVDPAQEPVKTPPDEMAFVGLDSHTLASPPKTLPKGIDPGLAAVFDEYKLAVENEEQSAINGDYETHYNLGLAYKEMDLLEEAVEEFQAAAGLVAPADGTPRYLQCCNLLGHCFMNKGMHRLAVMWFKKGLEAPGHTEDEYQALRYELGTAYQQMGDLDKAVDVFTEVYGVNVSYRGVSDKLKELQKTKA